MKHWGYESWAALAIHVAELWTLERWVAPRRLFNDWLLPILFSGWRLPALAQVHDLLRALCFNLLVYWMTLWVGQASVDEGVRQTKLVTEPWLEWWWNILLNMVLIIRALSILAKRKRSTCWKNVLSWLATIVSKAAEPRLFVIHGIRINSERRVLLVQASCLTLISSVGAGVSSQCVLNLR